MARTSGSSQGRAPPDRDAIKADRLDEAINDPDRRKKNADDRDIADRNTAKAADTPWGYGQRVSSAENPPAPKAEVPQCSP
jgi:hypothetical protein